MDRCRFGEVSPVIGSFRDLRFRSNDGKCEVRLTTKSTERDTAVFGRRWPATQTDWPVPLTDSTFLRESTRNRPRSINDRVTFRDIFRGPVRCRGSRNVRAFHPSGTGGGSHHEKLQTYRNTYVKTFFSFFFFITISNFSRRPNITDVAAYRQSSVHRGIRREPITTDTETTYGEKNDNDKRYTRIRCSTKPRELQRRHRMRPE